MSGKIKGYTSITGDPNKLEKKNYVSYLEIKNRKDLTPVADNLFTLVLVEKGNGVHTINAKDYQVKPRQIHITNPGQRDKWKLQPEIKAQRLVIKRALIETFSSSLQFPFSDRNQHPVLDLDNLSCQKIRAEFSAIKKELSTATIFMELVNARCRLIALMINLWMEHKFSDKLPSQAGSLSYRFHALVEKHFKTQKSVAFYAKHLCITPNYLGVICRKQYGMSALELIQERVLLEAKRLLHSSDRSIKEIAFDLGFRNQTYFGYFFKTKTGLTPKEYKVLMEKS